MKKPRSGVDPDRSLNLKSLLRVSSVAASHNDDSRLAEDYMNCVCNAQQERGLSEYRERERHNRLARLAGISHRGRIDGASEIRNIPDRSRYESGNRKTHIPGGHNHPG